MLRFDASQLVFWSVVAASISSLLLAHWIRLSVVLSAAAAAGYLFYGKVLAGELGFDMVLLTPFAALAAVVCVVGLIRSRRAAEDATRARHD